MANVNLGDSNSKAVARGGEMAGRIGEPDRRRSGSSRICEILAHLRD
jgi:hypothetical protein